MMSQLRHLGKQLARPFLSRIDERIDRRFQVLNHELVVLTKQVLLLEDTLSSRTAALEEASALVAEMRRERAHLEDELSAIRSRLEFARNELMYEIRYGGRAPGGAARIEVIEPRIVAPDRLQEFGGDVRLNLGCGHITLDGFLNVDSRELAGVDIVADVHRLPFPAGTVSRIHSAHLLEHFPIEELRRSLLPYWASLLRPGGQLTAVIPDAETMISEYSAGRMSFEELRLVTFGQQEYDKDFHFNMFSRASIVELLQQAGLHEVRIVASPRRNGTCYEMEVESRRPGGADAIPTSTSASTSGG